MKLNACLLWIIIDWIFKGADSVCPLGTFGRKCRYTCHCINTDTCDEKSGECGGGCAAGWSGPSCQRENIAFNRSCQQKEGNNSRNASFAVDADIDSCSTSKAEVPGWWTLKLDGVKRVTSFTLITDYLSDFYNWKVYVGDDDEIFSMTLCITIQLHDNGATLDCQEPINGRYVKIVNRIGPVIICDFRIYDCSPFTFDRTCIKTCNCFDFSERCDRKDGMCVSGCASGWAGQDCQTECNGHYGENCAYPCGHCRDSPACDRFIGTCPDGCEQGWLGRLCNQPCQYGRYGVSCAEVCGHCYEHTPCNHINGTCEKGCQAGWTGARCKERCKPGFFGENCAHACGHCLNEQACDPVSGVCENGCEPGWEGLFCTQECLPAYYGNGCQQSCMNCFQGLCHKVTGQCLYGCRPGRIGINCTQECDFNAFGVNCSSTCDRCRKGQGRLCDVTTGLCTYGCLPGFNGTNCAQACPDGFYGINCASKCGACKPGTTCNKTTGWCIEECAKNYYGDFCETTDAFVDESTPQLQVFLGTMLGLVCPLMTLVVVCLVLVWKREHLPKIELFEPPQEKKLSLQNQNSTLLNTEEEIEDEL